MNNSANSIRKISLPDDRIISMALACSDSGRPGSQFVQAAAEDKIELLFLRPSGPFAIGLMKTSGLGRPSAYGVVSNVPDYFAIEPKHAKALLNRNSTDVFSVERGYRTRSFNSYLTVLDASRSGQTQVDKATVLPHGAQDPYPDIPWQQWTFFTSEGGAISVSVAETDLYLRLGTLAEYLGFQELSEIQQMRSEWEDRAKREKKKVYLSEQLHYMNQIAELWRHERIIPDDLSTHPTNDFIVTKLLEIKRNDGTSVFNSTNAKAAAQLIKPAWGHKAGRRQKMTQLDRNREKKKFDPRSE